MNVVLTVVVLAAIASALGGIVTSAVSVLPSRGRGSVAEHYEDSRNFAVWTIGLGIFFIISPSWFFGPSWSYFPSIPHNGFGMGACLTVLACAQLILLWRHGSVWLLAKLFFLAGFVYWTAAVILAAEGIMGHKGLIESALFIYVGAHKFGHSAKLQAESKSGHAQ